jgi:N-acetyl-alpha-D-muramate 1-phosphate uridylyltransferase
MLPVAILAGGLATRLRPVTETIPKALVEIAGEPFLAHQLRLLARAGYRRIVMCVGYRAQQIEEFAGNGREFGVEIAYSPDGPQLLGTAGALKRALPLLGDAFAVVYGDSYLTCDYAGAERSFLASGKLGLMTVYRNEGQWDTSNVEFTDGRIVAYDKANRTPAMHYIDYGLGMFRAAAFDDVPADQPSDLASLYQRLLRQDELAAWESPDRFYEIGSQEGIRDLTEFLRR